MKILHFISGPRNISTALMYSFAQRCDTVVVDEPYYAVYLLKTGLEHPGRDAVIQSQPNAEAEVSRNMLMKAEKPIRYIKNMAHHLEFVSDFPFDKCTNVFLIRDPLQIILSYVKIIEMPVMRDIGLAHQFRLFEELKSTGQNPLVIDSGILMQDPPAMLEKACLHLEIPYEKQMLSWKVGPKPYDGNWAPYWYKNVHQTTGFAKQQAVLGDLPSHLLALYQEAKRYYDSLLPYAIK